MTKYNNTEKGYLKERYQGLTKKNRYQKRNGQPIKCYFTFDEFFAAWEKHKSTYEMKSAWGPGVDHLEQHLPITMIQKGDGTPGTRGGRRKGAKSISSNLSVDRLDSSKPYTIQNLIFIRGDENSRKKNTTYEDCKIQMRLHEERFINMESI